MSTIHDILDEIDKSTKKLVLATVIQVEGSAYRKEGASMLFIEDGRHIGTISAGCLETDLKIQVNALLNDIGILTRKLVYDMSSEDDLSWGRGAGCNGKVHILLEKIIPNFQRQLCKVRNYLKKGIPVISFKILKNNPDTVKTIFITKDNQIFGHEQVISDYLMQKLKCEEKPHIQYIDELKAKVFINYFLPKARLYIFGAGPDVRPLVSMAAKTGFSVYVWDWRLAYCKKEYFPDANILQDTSIAEVLQKIKLKSTDSVIIMTHDFQKDKELLHSILKYKHFNYIGILGPRKRTVRLLDGKNIPKHLHSPVGLPIGADGPEEISISIIADIIQAMRIKSKEKVVSFE